MHRKILRWLSLDDFEGTYEKYFEKRFKNTGQWLLDDPRFIDWRDGTQSSLLWCYGARKLQSYIYIYMWLYSLYDIVGTGKTILAYGHLSL